MNSLVIAVVSLVAFFWAYRFYAKKLEVIWQINPNNTVPSKAKYDGIDYVPAKNWLVLFGHHFASIAGAGPIIGPVIAVMLWGWLPALLWVILGSIFIGGVHDFGSMITSVREGGSSIADVAQHVISKRAKLLFSLFVWLALILVIAVFAYLCADTFVKEPKIVMPSLGLIPVAVLTGYLLYHFYVRISLATILGLVLLTGLIFLGTILSINSTVNVWLLVLFIYSYFASILPVNLLLQPRDYLSSYLLFFGVAVGYLGLILSHPSMNLPYFIKLNTSSGYLWPALFVTVACGAISGFHSLISSGTSSKQIANERHVKRVGYGAMVAEGLVAVLAIVAVSVLFNRNDDLGLILKNKGPIPIFGQGYNLITRRILGNNGQLIAITILNAFILTTLDTATRIARYITEELFNIKNRYLSTIIIVIASAALAFTGKWSRIWPVFGASNQLVAALALFVVTCWLLSKNWPIKFVLWPGIFMLVTTLAALALQIITHIKNKDFVLLAMSVVLVILAIVMTFEVIKTFKRHPIIRNKKDV